MKFPSSPSGQPLPWPGAVAAQPVYGARFVVEAGRQLSSSKSSSLEASVPSGENPGLLGSGLG